MGCRRQLLRGGTGGGYLSAFTAMMIAGVHVSVRVRTARTARLIRTQRMHRQQTGHDRHHQGQQDRGPGAGCGARRRRGPPAWTPPSAISAAGHQGHSRVRPGCKRSRVGSLGGIRATRDPPSGGDDRVGNGDGFTQVVQESRAVDIEQVGAGVIVPTVFTTDRTFGSAAAWRTMRPRLATSVASRSRARSKLASGQNTSMMSGSRPTSRWTVGSGHGAGPRGQVCLNWATSWRKDVEMTPSSSAASVVRRVPVLDCSAVVATDWTLSAI